MRATGIVRRMDELGRVVIPKELRRTMRIREGEELEVFTTDDNALDKVVAVSGDIKGIRIGDPVSDKLLSAYEGRRRTEFTGADDVFAGKAEYRSAVVAPIISGGDVMGGVVILSSKPASELAAKTAETAAAFFASRV